MSVKAPIERRIKAFLIDAAASASILSASSVAAYASNSLVGDAPGVILALAFLLAGVLSSSGFVLLRDALGGGAGFGKRWMRVRVVRSDGSRCDYPSSVIRNSTLLVPFLGFLDLAAGVFDREGLRLGDRLAGTQVVD